MVMTVAVSSARCRDQYAPKHVSGWSVWRLTIAEPDRDTVTACRCVGFNVTKPTGRAVRNADIARRMGLL